MSEYRLPQGGRIERSRPIHFRFNGRQYQACQGDTLASGLLANGVHLVGRSFKYHRPRGIISAGSEETNALVQLTGQHDEPNVQATRLELYDGLEAHSINCWPGVRWDLGALNNLLSPLLPAGFYYKTFMAKPWDFYSRYIRRLAGLGNAPTSHDTHERYERRYHHCDLLIVGAGPAGLAAALLAARSGARVMLVDEQSEPGGDLLNHPEADEINGKPALHWVDDVISELESLPNVLCLLQSTAAGYYDHNLLTVVEHKPAQNWLRERLWRVRARQVIIASGAIERPLVFPNNDRPGVMLAASVRTYLNRYALRCGFDTVIFTNNNSAYATAFDLARSNTTVLAIIDVRDSIDPALQAEAEELNIFIFSGHAILSVSGTGAANMVEIAPLDDPGNSRRIVCDLVAHSGGWNPLVHLHSQSGAKPVYDAFQACFIPGAAVQAEQTIGAARGLLGLRDCLHDGLEAAASAIQSLELAVVSVDVPDVSAKYDWPLAIRPSWLLNGRPHSGKAFVDFQNDVTSADLQLAIRENFTSVEHVKRYTTAGMATDQGKTSNVNAIGIIAEQLGIEPGEVGTTTFRPPYTPVSFGVLAGQDQEQLILPMRHTVITSWNIENGAAMNEAGAHFRRPFYYPKAGENLFEATMREARATRSSAAMYDSSPLGKFMLNGPDVVTFLNRIYSNRWDDLAIGQGKFGLMLREDGKLLDDGVTFRLAEQQYLMSAGTGAADAVYAHMERLLQCEWPDLKVYITTVTAQWADICVCGPKAREILQHAGTNIDLESSAFPFLAIREGKVAGFDARIARVSYTGELSFEIYIRNRDGRALWEKMLEAGKPFDITPIGSETSGILRIEKGFISAGTEGDNLTNPFDAGMDWVVNMNKGDFIGRRALVRDLNTGGERQQVVGLLPQDKDFVMAEGSAIIEANTDGDLPIFLGHVTASCYSPNLDRSIALALLKNGRQRHGDIVTVSGLEKTVQAEVTKPVFIDAKGERMRS